MTHLNIKIILALFLTLFFFHTLSACTLTMGYRSSERLPLITKEPFNSGLYQHLYTIAAEKIGCKLKVIRGPKKRIIQKLKKGTIDFYPGFNYSSKRAMFVHYIENGLPGGNIGISRPSLGEITDLKQLKGLTFLMALGTNDFLSGTEGVKVRKIREMTVARAIALIQKKRGDFYIYNKSTLEYYLTKNNITDLKIHPNCCGGIAPLYIGFSKKSSYFKVINNPTFNKNKPESIINNPIMLDETSIAYQFEKMLHQLKITGETNKLYQQYYK